MIILCLASDNYLEKFDFCIDSQHQYCDSHNYTYQLISGPKESRNWKRSKIAEVKNLLINTDHDVLMIDSDCFIKDNTPSLDSIKNDKSIYYAHGLSNRLNSGFMLFKNDSNSKKFITDLEMKLELPVPKHKNYFVTTEGENGHVIWLVDEYLTNGHNIFDILESKWNNTNPLLEDSSYVLHFTNHLKKLFPRYKNEYSRSSSES